MKKIERQKIAKNVVKLAILIIFLSIICQIFVSILPWISVSESDYVKKDLHFNYEMIKNSDNNEISNLAGYINFINLSLWSLIIIGLLSFLGAIIHISKKFSTLGYILLYLGCTTLIFCIISIYFQFAIIGKIENIDTISVSAISPFFNYNYILLIHSIIILVLSSIYNRIIISDAIIKFMDKREEKKDKKEKEAILVNNITNTEFNQDFKNEELKEKVGINQDYSKIATQQIVDTEVVGDPEIEEKHKEIEQFLDGKDLEKDKPPAEEKPPKSDKKESLNKDEPNEKDIKVDKKDIKEIKEAQKEAPVFTPEKNKLKPKDSYEPTVSESFEKALSSAIKKKHASKDKVETSENTNEIKKEAETKKTQKEINES